MSIFVVVIIFIVFSAYLIGQMKRPPKFPPGPMWLPFVGNHFQLRKLSKSLGGLHLALSHLSSTYKTGVLGLKLGKDYVVVVSKFSLIKKVLTLEEFEGRPKNFFLKMRNFGRPNSGITVSEGLVWSTHRNFVLRYFCSLGFGKKPMEIMVKNEIEEVLQVLKNNKSSLHLAKFFAPAVLNILWTLVSGRRISRNDKFLNELLDLLVKRGKMFDVTGGVLNWYPWIRYLAPQWSGFSLVEEINFKLKKMISTTIKEHYETWNEGRDDDLIYAYISEIKKSGNNSVFCDEELMIVCLDIFIAGSQITANSLELLFFMMTQYPAVQRKVHEEIDKEIEPGSNIEYNDIKRLPYTNAVLLEMMRYAHVAPVAGIRRAKRDTTLDGYFIPQESTVFINFHTIHHDKEDWKNPEIFEPQRFLNAHGKLITPEKFIPFGTGRRRCLGEVLAKQSLFHCFVEIMRKYGVSSAFDSRNNGKLSLGIFLIPENYKARFVER